LYASKRLRALLVMVHLLAGTVIFTLVLDWIWHLALLISVAISFLFCMQQQNRQPIVALRLGPSGELEVFKRLADEERCQEAQIDEQTSYFPSLIVLWFRIEGVPFVLPLLPDALDLEHFRQLRVWLQWRAKIGVKPTRG
jgi:hypothetical protein